MRSRFRVAVVLLGLAMIVYVSPAQAVDDPTLGEIRIAILYNDRSDKSTVDEFKRELARQGWQCDDFAPDVVSGANDEERVSKFREDKPEYEVVVEGLFGQEGRLALTVYWEEGRRDLLPSKENQPFADVVAEFFEFVQSPKVQNYLFERRKDEARSDYRRKLDDAWDKYRNSDWSKSKQIVEEALESPEAKGDWQPFYLLAHCHKNMEEFEKARENLEKVRKLNPSYTGAVLELGNLDFAQGDFSNAQLWYAEAIDRGTSNLHRARWNLALTQQILQEWDDAKKNYELLLTNPTYSMKARQRIGEIDARLNTMKRQREEASLQETQRAVFYGRLRGGLSLGVLVFATAWVFVLQRPRQGNKSVSAEKKVEPTEKKVEPTEKKVEPTEKKAEPEEKEAEPEEKKAQSKLTDMLTQALLGIWLSLLSALATTFLKS